MLYKCPKMEQAFMSIPELFKCPHCGQEIEIWEDEKRGRCALCKKRVTRREAMESATQRAYRQRQPLGGNEVSITVCEGKGPKNESLYYERYETIVPLATLTHRSKNKAACQACKSHGTNLACPPFSPTFQEYTMGKASARVLCLRLPLDYFSEELIENRYRLCFKTVREFLVQELALARNAGQTIAGAGPCMACDPCVAEHGIFECIKPEEKIFSLESLGINLMELAKSCFDITLEWSTKNHTAQFVCAMGAIFSEEEAP